MACALLPARNSHKIIRRSLGVVSDMVMHVNFHRSPYRSQVSPPVSVTQPKSSSHGINSLDAYNF